MDGCMNGKYVFSPSSVQISMTALKARIEKSTLQSMYRRSGNWIRTILCMGVKWMMASAVKLYWSKVCRVLSNHKFFSGHQMAWSDQSMAISATITKKNSHQAFKFQAHLCLFKGMTWMGGRLSGISTTVRDSKGTHDSRRLLEHPGPYHH